MTIILCLACLIIGGLLGATIMACCAVAKRADEEEIKR